MPVIKDSEFVRFRTSKRKFWFTYLEFFWMFVLLCIFCYFCKEILHKTIDDDGENRYNIERIEYLELKSKRVEPEQINNTFNHNIHIFYYAWYANPEIDGEFRHWNYKYVPAWEQNDHVASPIDLHYPPIDIGSNYYPTFGCYSSNDPEIIDLHMKLIRNAGIGVLVISWRPPNFTDSLYNILQTYFDVAQKYNLKITIHIEHYQGRNVVNLREHLRIFLNRFGNHPSLYRIRKFKTKSLKKLPLIYIYDSYLIGKDEWKQIFGKEGQLSVRNTEIDAVFIGLLADVLHRDHIKQSQFDGFYTYFAANDFTYGSTWENWRSLVNFANQNELIFIPSVSPGYIDTRVRPWNTQNIKNRQFGKYYNLSWKSAVELKPPFISITSFNDWHEGTQIEPASPKAQSNFDSLHYEPHGPYFYLSLTKEWINIFNSLWK
ncbi:endo-alpha-12-mannosidase [Holotrichia oblita]|uniref:Endo-alpha-12-mannosidase n=1 Tax=Holotrichia oblita TaxID=644536 RepID=A0ACB9SW41_HOLOL|nr:endo-alpha-12-mannosidase [Holotrichia oblita]